MITKEKAIKILCSINVPEGNKIMAIDTLSVEAVTEGITWLLENGKDL